MLSKQKNRKLRSPATWMRMTEEEVHETFLTLPNAIKIGQGKQSFVYVPGKRQNKVVLVAHCDTVFSDKRRKNIVFDEKTGVYKSNSVKEGIGADDRAGCSILWRLRNSGHSLLIPNGEEIGCKGSYFLRDYCDGWNQKLQKEHCFMIQFDRRGSSDLVTYRVGSKEFIKWLENNLKGYKHSRGSVSDISVLCTEICGVNISTGYYNEHTCYETLNINEWIHTLKSVNNLLKNENLPKFLQPSVTNNSFDKSVFNEGTNVLEKVEILDINDLEDLEKYYEIDKKINDNDSSSSSSKYNKDEWIEVNWDEIDSEHKESIIDIDDIELEESDPEQTYVRMMEYLHVCESCEGIFDQFCVSEPLICPLCGKEH